jgi:hypothetical protein
MAQFRGYVEGNRKAASRLGSKKSGIVAAAGGWTIGAKVNVWYDEENDRDFVEVMLTDGSGHTGIRLDLGRFIRDGEGFKKLD